MNEPAPAEESAPSGTSALQALRERLGSMGNLTQREVDQIVDRLRSKARPGRHRK